MIEINRTSDWWWWCRKQQKQLAGYQACHQTNWIAKCEQTETKRRELKENNVQRQTWTETKQKGNKSTRGFCNWNTWTFKRKTHIMYLNFIIASYVCNIPIIVHICMLQLLHGAECMLESARCNSGCACFARPIHHTRWRTNRKSLSLWNAPLSQVNYSDGVIEDLINGHAFV